MATLISNANSTFTGAATFAAAEAGALALVLNRNTTTSIATATTVTSATFTVTNAKVIDGALLWLKTAGTTGTGTFKVDLQKGGVSQASVTVNKSDLPDSTNTNPVPTFFRFTGTATGDGGSNWTLVLTTVSGTGTATVTINIASATTTNYTRALRTTTAATAAATNDIYVIGELTGATAHTSYTVTMDQTATTAYGNGSLNSTTVAGGGIHIGYYGTLTFDNTINSLLRINGDLYVWQNGTLNIGSSGSEIPRNKTAILEFQPNSADGDYGLRCESNSTFNAAGLSRTIAKNIVQCKLTLNLASSGTTLNVDTDTGWLTNDEVCVASTTQTRAQCEGLTLSGDAGASSFTTGAASFAHSGTGLVPYTATITIANPGVITISGLARNGSAVSFATTGALPTGLVAATLYYVVNSTGPTFQVAATPGGTAINTTGSQSGVQTASVYMTQAEVGLLTRNVKIRSTSTTLMAYVYLSALATATVSWVEFRYLGANATNKQGIEVDIGTTANAKSITYCALRNFDVGGLTVTQVGTTSLNLVFSNNVTFNCPGVVNIPIGVTNNDWTLDSNLFMLVTFSITLADIGGTCTNNTIVGANDIGFYLKESQAVIGTFSGNAAHSGANAAIQIGPGTRIRGTIANFAGWRNSFNAVGWGSAPVNAELYWTNLILFGNAGTNFSGGDTYNIAGGILCGDTTFASTNNFGVTGLNLINLSNIDMSGTGGILAPVTGSDFVFTGTTVGLRGTVNNCKFGAPTLLTKSTAWYKDAYLSFQRYNQTAGDHRTETTEGQLKTDSTIFKTASPSMRMTPTDLITGTTLESAQPGRAPPAAVVNGGTVAVSVWVRKSATGSGDAATYNGNQPRLIQRANAALGQTADVVLATAAAAAGSWELLTATSSTATDDGAWEFIVDCTGTAGWVNVDDWLFVGATTTSNDLKTWFNGLPATSIPGVLGQLKSFQRGTPF